MNRKIIILFLVVILQLNFTSNSHAGSFIVLAKLGAKMICVPSAFTLETGTAHWHTLLRARAIETGAFIFAPAQVGDHPGQRQTFGHSLIVDPWGVILADAGVHSDIIFAEIDIEKSDIAKNKIPSLSHDRNYEF